MRKITSLRIGLFIWLVCVIRNRFFIMLMPEWIAKPASAIGCVLIIIGLCARYISNDLEQYPIIGKLKPLMIMFENKN